MSLDIVAIAGILLVTQRGGVQNVSKAKIQLGPTFTNHRIFFMTKKTLDLNYLPHIGEFGLHIGVGGGT